MPATNGPATPPVVDRLLLFNLATDADDPILGFAHDWVASLAPYAGAIDVVSMTAGRLDLPANVRVYSVGKERGFSEPRRVAEFYRILTRLLHAARYDACFAHMMPLFAVMGAPLLRAYRVPITVWYAHGAVTRMLRVAERIVDRAVTSHPGSFRLVSPKLQAIGQAIDLDMFRPLPTERPEGAPFTVMTVGRVAPVKRVDVMVEGVARLAARIGDGVRLRLVGPVEAADQEYVDRLVARARALGIVHLVDFVGAVPRVQLPVEYAGADVAVNLTKVGAFDKSGLEAMACGVPLVCSNRGMVEQVNDIDPKLAIADADPELLASALRYVHDLTPAERATLGGRLRTKMQDHSMATFPERLFAAMPRRSASAG